jgi:hypothetical protein
VLVFKTKAFARFAKREGIEDAAFCEAVRRAGPGLIDADLGGGLIKQRVARKGQGRSGGFRTLMAFRSASRTVFVYGFAKKERDNIGADELVFWRKVAAGFLAANKGAIEAMAAADELTEVICDDDEDDVS